MPPFLAHAPGAAEGVAGAVYTTLGGRAQGGRRSGRGCERERAHVRECRRRKPAILTDEALGARAYGRGSAGAGAGASDTQATPEACPALIRAAYTLRAVVAAPAACTLA